MIPELIVIDSLPALERLEQYLSDKTYVAYDCETTGLTKQDRVVGFSVCAEETKAFYVIIEKWNAVHNSLAPTECAAQAGRILSLLKDKSLIMHNGVFDCMMAEAALKVDLIGSLHTDTMVLAHLLDENRRVGLKELGKSMFGEDAAAESGEMLASALANGGIVNSKTKEMFKADPYILGKYGAKDAWLTYRLFLTLVPELFAQGLDKFFYDDESMPLLRGPTYQLNNTGCKVDLTILQTLKKTLEAECAEAKTFIYAEIDRRIKTRYPGTAKKTTFNIGSSKQLAWLLFGELELEFGTLTDKGKDACRHLGLRLPYTLSAKREFIAVCTNRMGEECEPAAIVNGKKKAAKKIKAPWDYIKCDKKTLTKLAPRYKWIDRLLEYQRKMKILSTYVKGIESRVQYGIIHPSFLQHGTTGGRYSSRNPNWQNLPRDDKRVKACVVARPGKVFVGADYSQLEPRVFAYFSKDERLLKSFAGEDDFYSVIGMEVFDKTDCIPRKDGSPDAFGVKYKKLRDHSKVIALASTYGATAHQLAPTTGKTIEATQDDIDRYFERFPGVRKFMLDSHAQAKETGRVVSLFGRPRRIPEAKKIDRIYGKQAHADLPYEARTILNLAVNHRVQSTGASIVNRAAILYDELRKKTGIESSLVVQVHDSLVVECDEADGRRVSDLLRRAMETAVVLDGVSLEAIPKIGKNLAEV